MFINIYSGNLNMEEFIYLEGNLCYTYAIGLYFPQNSEQFSIFPLIFFLGNWISLPRNYYASFLALVEFAVNQVGVLSF